MPAGTYWRESKGLMSHEASSRGTIRPIHAARKPRFPTWVRYGWSPNPERRGGAALILDGAREGGGSGSHSSDTLMQGGQRQRLYQAPSARDVRRGVAPGNISCIIRG